MNDARPRGRHKPRPKPHSPQSPRLKVVIRRLPPTLPEDILLTSIAAWDKQYDWFSYVPGKPASTKSKSDRFSRAYLKFRKNDDLVDFQRRYNGHAFITKDNTEYRACVELAPYQKVPVNTATRAVKDNLHATINEDREYIAFLASLEAPIAPLIVEQQAETKITPLIEYLRIQKAKSDAKSKAKKAKASAAKTKQLEEKKAAAQQLADASTAKITADRAKTARPVPEAEKGANWTQTKKGKGKSQAKNGTVSNSTKPTVKPTGLKEGANPATAHVSGHTRANATNSEKPKPTKKNKKKETKPENAAATKSKKAPNVRIDISGPTPAEMAAAAAKAKT